MANPQYFRRVAVQKIEMSGEKLLMLEVSLFAQLEIFGFWI